MKCLLSNRSSDVSTDTIIGSVGLHDWCGCVVEEVQLLTIGYGLLAHLKRTNALGGPFEFAIALIRHIGDVVTEIISEPQKLQ